MKKNKTLHALFSFPGFKAKQRLQGKFGDPKARIIELKRQKKQQSAQVVESATEDFTIASYVKHVIWMRRIIGFMCVMKNDAYIAADVACG